jgi:CHASE2 domain-containing sensor protein
VALKLIKPGMDSKQVLARFEAERQALALMNHPNIARVFDAGATELGHPYFVMELVAGVPITEYCDREMLSNEERLGLFLRVCEAVQHAHSNGIIHRDLKPSNVLVSLQDGKPVPKVIDFGVAKATSQRLTEKTLFTELGTLIGTPEYMSPEQADVGVQDVDARTDIYSLGVLLYELLVGTLPFDVRSVRGAGLAEMQRMIRESIPSTPSARISDMGAAATDVSRRRRADARTLRRDLRGNLDWIVMKALQKDRARRYATAAALAEDLTRHLRGERVASGSARMASLGWAGVLRPLTLWLLPGLIGIGLLHWPATTWVEHLGLDPLFRLRGPRLPPQNVCVVAIDDESYAEMAANRMAPLPRGLHAELIRKLELGGARAVAFDILFLGEGNDPAQNAALTSAISDAKNVVLADSALSAGSDATFFRPTEQDEGYAPFGKAAAAIGNTDIAVERDGIMRFAWPTRVGRPGLALSAYEVATGDTSQRLEEARIVDHYGPARTIKTIQIFQALDPPRYLPSGFFQNKIVFVGATLRSASTSSLLAGITTPFGSSIPSVEIHATIAANLIEHRSIRRVGPLLEAMYLLLVALIAAMTLSYSRSIPRALAFLVTLATLIWVLAYWAFVHAETWLPPVVPSIVVLPLAVLLIAVRRFVPGLWRPARR